LDLSRRAGRGDIWRRQGELLENRLYNKPNGCSATDALALGSDHHHHQQQQQPDAQYLKFILFWNNTLHITNGFSVHQHES
jgi:hypothetical protein